MEKLRVRKIEDFTEFTTLTKEEATIILILYKWNVEKIKEIWYDNIEENRRKCGLDLFHEVYGYNTAGLGEIITDNNYATC